ncbi:hypothetical protein UA08_05977 [Talaromyces atroroseus]|uniref:NAD-dependent epimerase/dehydratase domain-containing protein n=1 Tax=Talaromyces atroroseus TaxID=1441469 RepID=A0A225AU56_TALAT|nr:hypothetical protein UA08_05977 [Talaromyces atroroseus]OKL58466.1 hypothetical protein UA08_05977 [Talaromyces atroroseus]
MAATIKKKVFLTGGSGFIASHILDQLLSKGYGTNFCPYNKSNLASYHVIVTVRSNIKGDGIISALPQEFKGDVSYEVVEDIAQEGAFDESIKANPNIDYVIHTASPYHHNIQDPVKDFIDPAVKGTTGILYSIQKYAPTSVKRVIVLSSTATIVNPPNHPEVYNEEVYGATTWEQAISGTMTYRASKIYAERAAFEFIVKEKPSFDLVTINPCLVFGPPPRHLTSLDALNTSNHRTRDLVLGNNRDKITPTGPLFLFVDVRDVATAHINALENPEASGQRFMLVGGYFSNKRIADCIRELYPELRDRLPPVDSPDDFPEKIFRFDVSKSKRVLGTEYRDLRTCVKDTVDGMLGKA